MVGVRSAGGTARADANLRAFVPRLVTELAATDGDGPVHARIDGTLVFADVSGFTALSERLARAGGKAGAEELTVVIDRIFGDLLDVAGRLGGEMLKYGGDAVLLLFRDEGHPRRAVAAARAMQRALDAAGRIDTGFGRVKLRMSVGVHSGDVDVFLAGPHRELVVAGPAATTTVTMEAAANADEVLLSADTAAHLPDGLLGDHRAGGRLLRRAPQATPLEPAPAPDVDVRPFVPARLLPLLESGIVPSEHRPVAIGFVSLELPEPSLSVLHDALTIAQAVLEEYELTFLASDVSGGAVKLIVAAGVPVAQPDAEERLLRALRDAVDGRLPVPARAGVQRGHVFAGTVGPSFRRTYTVLGDVVNTAARLMARAKPGEVLTLLPVLERCTSEFELTELEPFVAKGKAEPLLPLRVGPPTGRPRPTGDVLPLMGRDAELRTLLRAIEEGGRTAGAFIDLVGEAGIGKSRLVDEVELHYGGPGTLRVTCSPLDTATPYRAASELLRALTGVVTASEVEALIERVDPEAAPYAPLVAIALGIEMPATPEVERLDPKAVPAKLRDTVVAVVRSTVPSPVLALVEDFYWVDASSVALIEAIGAAVGEMPLTLIVTRRPDESTAPKGATTVEVGPLAEEASADLVQRLAGRPLLPDVRSRLVERAGGNPFFLRELGLAVAAGDDVELPDRVESLIARRIDDLDPADREVLRVAAVAGTDFEVAEVEAGAGRSITRAVWDRLAPFVADGERVGALRLRHALLRDAAYAGLPYRIRRQVHARIGVFLEAQPGHEDRVERLAAHFAAAGDASRTWRYMVASGRRAESRYAWSAASSFLMKAVDVVRSLPVPPTPEEAFEVFDLLGLSLQREGRPAEAQAICLRARRHFRGDDNRLAWFWLHEAQCRHQLGQFGGVERAVTMGLALLDAEHEVTRARFWAQRAIVASATGRHALALRRAKRAVEIATASGDEMCLAAALATRYQMEMNSRLPGRSGTADAALEIYERLEKPAFSGALLNWAAVDAKRSGDLRRAASLFDRAEQLLSESGWAMHAAVAGYNRANLLALQGHRAEALTIIDRVLGVFLAAGFRQGELMATQLRGYLLGLDGRAQEGIALLWQAAAQFRALPSEEDALECELNVAEVQLLDGMPPGEVPPADTCTLEVAVRVHWVVAAHHAREGGWDAARTELDAARRAAEQLESTYHVAITRVMRGLIDPSFVEDRQAALDELEAMGVVRVPLLDYLMNLKFA